MKLLVNGKEMWLELDKNKSTLAKAITELGYNPSLVVVELNGTIVSSASWEGVYVRDGDALEIVTIVGGGS